MNIPVVTLNTGTETLPTLYQQFIHKSRYARWNDVAARRETWFETVLRYCNFFHKHLLENFDVDIGSFHNPKSMFYKVFYSIYNLEVMPSMRCLMTAGLALELENMCGFNCTYRAITDTRAFAEIMYILMCGCGVGFSVERQYIAHLPIVPKKLKPSDEVIVVEDNRLGWADAFNVFIHRLYEGYIPQWNTDKVRKKGTRLKTMGGFASGPEPLIELFKFTIKTFQNAVGRRLNSLECHDLTCKIGDVVVMGGVRRSALISLSNPSDMRMRHAKMGDWPRTAPWRALANNSAAYTEKPTPGAFMAEWLALYDSKSGERGIVNRLALIAKAEKLGRRIYWDDLSSTPEDLIEFGVNPCAEIILRSCQTCNLSEIVARPDDDIKTLVHKAAMASILGTWQSTLTKFNFVNDEWRQNCEEERLLGVSITGIMDNPILANREHELFNKTLTDMHHVVRRINDGWAEKLKIAPSAATTCVKPSGTVSQLVNSSSGIHSRYAPHYIRRAILDNSNPICEFLKGEGLPHEPHASPDKANLQTVFAFPIKSPPSSAPTTKERSAVDQLEHWKAINNAWAEHSVSCTIEIDEHEWPEVGGWIYNNFDQISGLSFLPKTDMIYQQAPYEPISEAEYEKLSATMPKRVDWNKLADFEKDDHTTVGHEFACHGNACELVRQ